MHELLKMQVGSVVVGIRESVFIALRKYADAESSPISNKSRLKSPHRIKFTLAEHSNKNFSSTQV